MRRTVWRVGVGLAATALATAALLASQSPAAKAPTDSASGFTLASPDISAGGRIADSQVFTASGARAATSRRRCPGAIPPPAPRASRC